MLICQPITISLNHNMTTSITTDKQVNEKLLYQQAKKLYGDIEAYIARYPLYIDIPDKLVELKHYLYEHFIRE